MSYQSFNILNNLEEFSFIAGNSYTLEYEAFEEDEITPLDLGGATVDLVLCPFGQTDVVSLHVVGTITGTNTFEFDLLSNQTKSLSGKYTQQPVITSFSGSEYRPSQGVILVLSQIPVP